MKYEKLNRDVAWIDIKAASLFYGLVMKKNVSLHCYE